MISENIMVFTGSLIEVASEKSDDTCKYATFLISVLDEYDRMGRLIPYETGVQCHETLRGFPIVAKLLRDRGKRPIDFGAHEVRQWTNRKGETQTTFDTFPVGSVVDTWIEEREVPGYEGIKQCIMAKAKLWTCRSPEYFTVLDKLYAENKVTSSWEMITSEVEEQPLGKKILKAFSFIGNALLGTNSIPAVKGAGIYEYAEAEEEYCQTSEELNEALLRDISNTIERTDNSLEDVKTIPEQELDKKEEELDGTTTDTPSEETPEEAAVTPEEEKDEGEEVPVEEETKTEPEEEGTEDDESKKKNDDDAATANDIKTLSEALMQANEVIQQLQEQISSFAPIKEEYDRMTAEKAEAEKQAKTAELKERVLKTKQITEAEFESDEDIKSMLANLDEDGLNRVIVSRLTDSLSKNAREYSVASAGRTPIPTINIAATGNSGASVTQQDKAAAGAQIVKTIISK